MNERISGNKQNSYPVAAGGELVVQELKDETLIYNLTNHKAYCLNATASFVWKRCDGETSVAEIARKLAKVENQPVSEEIVWLALEQLKEQNLLAASEKVSSPFGGMSRREVIRKVGLTTMMALPVISFLSAPPATAAASPSSTTCSDAGTVCTAVNDCCPNVGCTAAGINIQAFVCLGLVVGAGGVVLNAGVCTRVAACVSLPLINI